MAALAPAPVPAPALASGSERMVGSSYEADVGRNDDGCRRIPDADNPCVENRDDK